MHDDSATPTSPSPLLSAKAAAEYLHLQFRTLANWRSLGKGPRFVRSGSRALYRQADLDAFVAEHTFDHTAAERARRERVAVAGGRR